MLSNMMLCLSMLVPYTYEELESAEAVRDQMEALYRAAQQEAQIAAWNANYWKELEQEEWAASVPYMMAGNMVAAQYHWQRAQTYAANKQIWEADLVLLRQEEQDAFYRWYEACERVRLINEYLWRQIQAEWTDPYR